MQFQNKSEVRQYVQKHRPDALPLTGVLKNLDQFLNLQKGNWGAFRALADEPAIEGCLTPSIKWFYPRLKGKDLEFVHPSGWRVSAMGFYEPSGGDVIDAGELDGFLVPGLAFSKKGQRIGRGKGFYDRALSQVKGLKAGLCYSYQLFEELPVENHDVHMDIVISEQGITWLKR